MEVKKTVFGPRYRLVENLRTEPRMCLRWVHEECHKLGGHQLQQ